MNFSPSEEEINFVNDALRKFNDEKVGPDNHLLLNIVEYDKDKNVIAGILGGTYWGWMHIDILWVDSKYRKQGLGSKLLQAAESEAKKRGCHSVHVDTGLPFRTRRHNVVAGSRLLQKAWLQSHWPTK